MSEIARFSPAVLADGRVTIYVLDASGTSIGHTWLSIEQFNLSNKTLPDAGTARIQHELQLWVSWVRQPLRTQNA